MSIKPIFLAAVLSLTGAAYANPITGNTVTCSVSGSGDFGCNQASAVVTTGDEFEIGGQGAEDAIGAGFGANGLELTFNDTGNIGGTILHFTDTTNAFTGFALDSDSGITGFTASDITITNGVLNIDLIGTSVTDGGDAKIILAAPSATPEPSSLMLLGSGLVGVAGLARRRFQQRTR